MTYTPTFSATPPRFAMNPVPPPNRHHDLEIKDAHLIFNAAWSELEEAYGRDNLRFPKEIILLGGAPGAGKGTQTRFIMNARGMTCAPIVVSELLNSPAARAIKDKGGMVGDREVISILLRTLLREEYRDGAILDGFPRTKVQVEALKLLVDRVNELRREFAHTPLEKEFRRPLIQIMVLFVDEKTSIDRQLQRGRQIAAHNARVAETGVGETLELRKTDLDPEAARHRYRVFKEQTWEALKSLKEHFHYHFIDAEGSLQEVEANILKELQYQSSLELDPRTFDRLRRIPLASEIVLHARQDLINRLDSYEIDHAELFHRVLDLVERRFMPIVIRHAISGLAIVNNEDPTLLENPLALAMVIDIFSERGFHAVVDVQRQPVPARVDLQTGIITCSERRIARIQIRFRGSDIRRG
jgi:adenylate kinase